MELVMPRRILGPTKEDMNEENCIMRENKSNGNDIRRLKAV
jgi:hypothetical protein